MTAPDTPTPTPTAAPVEQPATGSYWNSFYSGSEAARLAIPSQFAAFVAGEIGAPTCVVDLGCGTGRDSLFFSSIGHRVLGVDASESAIAHCRQMAERNGQSARFDCLSVGDAALFERLDRAIAEAGFDQAWIYSRFFLHAVPEPLEAMVLDVVQRLAATRRVRLAVEFRTHRDASLPKATSSHYRRFIDPMDFMARVGQRGFKVDYFVDGFGFAKYKDDDAHVARLVLSR